MPETQRIRGAIHTPILPIERLHRLVVCQQEVNLHRGVGGQAVGLTGQGAAATGYKELAPLRQIPGSRGALRARSGQIIRRSATADGIGVSSLGGGDSGYSTRRWRDARPHPHKRLLNPLPGRERVSALSSSATIFPDAHRNHQYAQSSPVGRASSRPDCGSPASTVSASMIDARLSRVWGLGAG